jgi:hypothetical protein
MKDTRYGALTQGISKNLATLRADLPEVMKIL